MSTTITALASATGGGIAILRVSGPQALSIAQRIFVPWPVSIQSHQLYYGHITDPEGNALDQVMLCWMQSPRSYTGEDTIEIYGHGGQANMEQLLTLVLHQGAQPAKPGEFTKRAFMAGKLDLTQAEAVAALINAASKQALKQSQRQLSGALGQRINNYYQRLIQLLGLIEGSLDFPDGEEDGRIASQLALELALMHEELHQLSASYYRGGKAIQQGIEIAFIGQANAGKSSLLNALCGQERALVDALPGTTRDYIEARLLWQDIPVTLIDTAGLREADSEMEKSGQRLGWERLRQADVVVWVADGSQPLFIPPALYQINQPIVVAWNKMDQANYRLVERTDIPFAQEIISISALCGWGIEVLKQAILKQVLPEQLPEILILNQRQHTLIASTKELVEQARQGLNMHVPWDIIAGLLRQARSTLGEITGAEVNEAVIDEIFAQFCVGK